MNTKSVSLNFLQTSATADIFFNVNNLMCNFSIVNTTFFKVYLHVIELMTGEIIDKLYLQKNSTFFHSQSLVM